MSRRIIGGLSSDCRNCMNVKTCDNKRMEMAIVDECEHFIPAQNLAEAGFDAAMSAAAPVLRTATPITIKLGESGTVHTMREEIQEQINKAISCSIGCYFEVGG